MSVNRFKNQKGQMAIFIALIFQVLFVFFAMVVNVGLLVHDKINLQNSVDLAAIYAAQRQAEVLNTIAHTNYQIRQSWKLLSWRLRVLGDMGRENHPLNSGVSADSPISQTPVVCVGNPYWLEMKLQNLNDPQNNCKESSRSGVGIPPIPSVPVILPMPWNIGVSLFTEQMKNMFNANCGDMTPTNWYMGALWLTAYKLDQANRKQVIRTLAYRLAQNDFQELRGGHVVEGVKKTLLANLTRSNKSSIDGEHFQFYNSMTGLSSGENQEATWLPEIKVYPVVLYLEGHEANGCQLSVKTLLPPPAKGSSPYDPRDLAPFVNETSEQNDLHRSSVGVEKNPWYMAYVAVKAQTKPRHLFAPFGKGVVLTARAFAQPFGGRIGPWYESTWPRGSNKSTGTPLDPLLPARDGDAGTDPTQAARNIPNYSRYPGDMAGLKSQLALSWARSAFPQRGGGGNPDISFFEYTGIMQDLNFQKFGDPLPYAADGKPASWIRNVEVAAIAPDLFDVTYYSIDSNFAENYLAPAVNMFGEGMVLRADLGYRKVQSLDKFSVLNQIEMLAGDGKKEPIDKNRKAFYQVHDPFHLLTSWAPNGAIDYTFPDSFGRCYKKDLDKVSNSGSCIAGGRTGYSVKIVSKDYLMSSQLPLGGEGSAGALMNPPPEDF